MTNSDWPEAAVTASGQLHPWGEFLANRTGFTPVPGGFETPSLHEIHYRYCRAVARQYLPRMNRQALMHTINSTPPPAVAPDSRLQGPMPCGAQLTGARRQASLDADRLVGVCDPSSEATRARAGPMIA